jgi:transglutaminase-like putative cysteine protease
VPSDDAFGVRRDVGSTVAFNFLVPSVIAVQIAAAATGDGELTEQLDVVWGEDAVPLPVIETTGPNCGRVHIIEADAGPVTIRYSASTASSSVVVEPPERSTPAMYDDEVITGLRQSRYCPSDMMLGYAQAELGAFAGTDKTAAAVASWVFERIVYIPGASGPSDNAVDTLLSGAGVCRDLAHLTITLCRALGVPARLVSVYAPGLVQMDFHAVVEVWRNGRWEVLDPTRLAPRSSLVRIATGRDAADTAFAATLRGDVELVWTDVFAVVDGDLPLDDHEEVVTLPYG